MANDIIVSEMTSASQINTNDLMIMTQPDLQAETGYSTKKGTVLQVANKMLKGTEYLTDLPDFTDKTVLGGLEELKGDLTALLPVDTASGAIANFDTDLSLPLVDCKANIVATGGNGTPSTPIPINGYTSCTISVADENMSVQDTHTVSWQDEAGTVYGGVLDVTSGKLTVNKIGNTYDGSSDENWSIIGASHRAYIAVPDIITNIADNVIGDILCNCYPAGSYTGSNSNRITYRYGIAQINIFDFDNITTEAAWRTQLSNTPLQVVYELATPFDIDLTPVQINTLLGVNNVFNDTNGDTEVKYKEGIQHYIDKKIAATQALIL